MARKILLSALGIIVLLSALVVGVFGVNCHYQVKEESAFRVAPWTPTTCPFPFYLDVRFKDKKDREEVWEAAMELHKEVGGPLGYGPLFLPAENLSIPPDKLIIPVRDALAHERKRGEVCGPIIPQLEAQFGGLIMGALHYRVDVATDTLAGGQVIMCKDRIDAVRDLKDKISRLPKHPMSFYVKHELMHLIIGGGHPQWGCGLMCSAPTRRQVNAHELAIVKRTYDPLCKPNSKVRD